MLEWYDRYAQGLRFQHGPDVPDMHSGKYFTILLYC